MPTTAVPVGGVKKSSRTVNTRGGDLATGSNIADLGCQIKPNAGGEGGGARQHHQGNQKMKGEWGSRQQQRDGMSVYMHIFGFIDNYKYAPL